MNAKPILARPHIGTTIVATVLSIVIGIGLLAAVASLFLHDGAPFEQIVVAERACAGYAFASERETCVRSFFAASRVQNVASR